MSIISISRGSYSRGVDVAQKVASRLGYECLARDAVLQASAEYDVPEIHLVRAIEDAPSIFQRLTRRKTDYIAFIKATLLRHFVHDRVVYHGLAGHFFLQGIGHALKVRILADVEDRVAIVMQREEVEEQEAHQILAARDKARRQWGLYVYGLDWEDPSLYDAVVHVGRIGSDGAADMICDMVKQDVFQTTPESQAAIEDLALAAAVEAVIAEMNEPIEARVTAERGDVTVRLTSGPRVRGGTFSGFRDHYAESLQQRLRQRTVEVPRLGALEVVVDY